MATVADWIEGARVRTLPAAVAPVLVGTGVAAWAEQARWLHAAMAAVVALALQVGVNFANDYSDGIRGTDAERVGPARLVGGGLAKPTTVKAAAFACFGLAALVGLGLIMLTQLWWLVVVGLAAIAAAWFYTGGEHPYGYAGLGEVFVFIFFGLVATAGTTLVQIGRIPAAAWWGAIAMGAMACALLVCNNLRDIPGDVRVGKRTLSVRIGDRASRALWFGLLGLSAVGIVAAAATSTWWALLGLLGLLVVAPVVGAVAGDAKGPALIPVLKMTGIAEFVMAAAFLLGSLVA